MNIFNKLKLGQKLGLGFGAIAVLLLIVISFSYISMQVNNDLFIQVSALSSLTDKSSRIQANFLLCRIAMKTLFYEKDTSQQAEYTQRYNNCLNFIGEYKKAESDSANLVAISNIEMLIEQYNDQFALLLQQKDTVLNGSDSSASQSSVSKMDEIGPEVSDQIEALKLGLMSKSADLSIKYERSLDAADVLFIIFSVGGALLAVVISFVFTRFLSKPILVLTKAFKNISEGDTDLSIRLSTKSKDEIGQMSGYFNIFMQKLRIVFDEIRTQNETNARRGEIDEITRGEKNLEEKSEGILHYLCGLTEAYIGAIYVRGEDGFMLRGSYAQSGEAMTLLQKISRNDGICGQAIVEKTPKILSKLPENYFKIKSATGEASPNSLLVFPCSIDNEVICVLEMASFNEFSPQSLEMLKRLSVVIATGINTAVSREKIDELYLKTLQQTEELRVQQEELMQNNEELTEQTNALIDREDQLQVQQEELRVTNTELERKNNELEKAKAELLEKANSLEQSGKYKSEFMANVSHELKTPLNSILVLSKLLMDRAYNLPLSEKEMQYAVTINNSGSELLALITDILDLAKVEAGRIDIHKENIPAEVLAEYFSDTFRHISGEKSVSFSVHCLAKGELVYTDDQRIKQIIKNLLSNAFKFTEKGKVELIISKTKEGNNSMFTFAVTDTGIGIEESKQAMIFEAFKQANGTINRKYGGTGLGLSISRQLAQILGGDITVSSRPGVGSTFTLILQSDAETDSPAAVKAQVPGSAPAENKAEQKNEEAPQKAKTILIIEDDVLFANILQDNAVEKGLKVFVAHEGRKGIALAKEKLPDAILLDLGLPDISGTDVIKELSNNQSTKGIPLHIITGRDGIELVEHDSVFSFIKKPVTLNRLRSVFNDLKSRNVCKLKNTLLAGSAFDEEFAQALMHEEGLSVSRAGTAAKALAVMEKTKIDCLILDKRFDDMTAKEFLESALKRGKLNIPIIVYTDKEVSREEEEELSQYSNSIIVKGAKSMDRLISELDIFLFSLSENTFLRKARGKSGKILAEDQLADKKVLIVDDDVRNIFSVSGILETKGMQVLVARNGKDGIEKFNKNPDVDLVLMDIMMPVIDGYETIRAIRNTENGKDIPIIAITAKSMPEDRAKCLEAGADDYLTKPMDVDKLLNLLRVWLK